MAWTLLVIAGLLEIVWAMAFKYADGFTRAWPTAIGITTAALSFVLLSLALKSLPVGTAYAVWVGIGTVGAFVAGIILFDESISWLRIASVALIVGGPDRPEAVVGLSRGPDTAAPAARRGAAG